MCIRDSHVIEIKLSRNHGKLFRNYAIKYLRENVSSVGKIPLLQEKESRQCKKKIISLSREMIRVGMCNFCDGSKIYKYQVKKK